MLSSWEGLIQAGIVSGVRFDPITGVVEVVYSSAYRAVLEDLGIPMLEAGFVAALLIDDPVAMRLFIESAVREG
jgi:hypothetical protein